MKNLIIMLMLVAITPSKTHAQSEPLKNPALLALQTGLEHNLASPDSRPSFAFDQHDSGGTLIVKFRTRSFIIHPIDKTGHISPDTVEREGPSENGFIIRASIEPLGTVHQALTPSGGRDIYWNYLLNVYPLSNTDEQMFFSLQYGSRLRKEIIERIKKIAEQIARPDGE